MTTERTDAELTKLAAQVMGWVAWADPKRTHEGWVVGMDGNQILVRHADSFNPLESIADAWMLVEKMRENGYRADVIGDPSKAIAKDAMWMCEFWGEKGGPHEFAETAPRAITLAAIAATEKETA